jgi:DNA polymerase (family 10)
MKIHREMTNLEIADLLRAVAASYELKDKNKNKFRIIAYERAADAVEHLSSEAKDLWDEGKLSEVGGIGDSIAAHLGEIFSKGKSKHFNEVMRGIPNQSFDLIEVSGIGPATAFKLAKMLNISSSNPLDDLLKKAKKGEIAKLEGFGEDSEKAIINSIKEIKGREKRMLLNYAMETADEIVAWMKNGSFVEKIDVLGSLRRKVSTIGDIDIAVATNKQTEAIDHFTSYPKTSRVLEKGDASASIILPGDIQVDLKVVTPDSYGSLLQHFTGSKHHNIALREYAKSLKPSLSLNEYGIKKAKVKNGKLEKYASEEGFYKALGMSWIPPELREDQGEIKVALQKAQKNKPRLPELIEVNDIKADLQIHSNFDIETSHDLGEASMEEIVKKADDMGYEYVAFTEHNPSQKGHNSEDVLDILKRKKEKIEHLNYSISKAKYKCIKYVFNSLEIDILPDKSLPVSDEALEQLDFALVSIHSSFKLKKEDMTKRVLSALNHPKIKIFAHPTARKINEREGIELDWTEVFDFCLKNNKWLEINADPMRLDLPDFLVYEAIKVGVKLTMGTDSHTLESLDNMRYAVYVARRGWAEKKDIVNTRTFEEFKKMIEST